MRPEKEAIVDEIRGYLERSGYVLLADCRGLTVEAMRALRRRLRDAAAGINVVKNAFLGRAADRVGLDGIRGFLDGPRAMIHGGDDVVKVARILREFIKEHGLPVPKGGVIGDRVLSSADVEEMAKIASREVLLGRLVGTVAAPMTQLVGVMQQKLSSLLYVLKAVEAKKAEAGN